MHPVIPHGLVKRGLLVPLALVGSGCVGTSASKTPGVPGTPERAIVTTEYEQVYLTGSHIPVLVPKSPTARRLPTTSPLVIMTAEDAVRAGFPHR